MRQLRLFSSACQCLRLISILAQPSSNHPSPLSHTTCQRTVAQNSPRDFPGQANLDFRLFEPQPQPLAAGPFPLGELPQRPKPIRRVPGNWPRCMQHRVLPCPWPRANGSRHPKRSPGKRKAHGSRRSEAGTPWRKPDRLLVFTRQSETRGSKAVRFMEFVHP